MQDYTYSVFSSVAIVIHLIINFRLFTGCREGLDAARVTRYRGFLFGVDPTTFTYRPESLPEADAKLMRECARDALKAASNAKL